jgi:SAM-dependent methyltransferase
MANRRPEPKSVLTRDSVPLFDALADHYEEHFQAPHRRAYDRLAWERVRRLLPSTPGLVIDAGCGIGRWAARLVRLGHRVVGIEQAPAMVAKARERNLGDRFTIIEGSMEDVPVKEGQADAVIAMGSLQYTTDPAATIARFARWLRPGGMLCVLIDSRLALVLELLRDGKGEEAMARLKSRLAVWSMPEGRAQHHLLDRSWLQEAFARAGLVDLAANGLLVSATVLGVKRFDELLEVKPKEAMAQERILAADPLLADVGKHVLMTGRQPG